MNVYFLVEGAKTEPAVYRAWLSHLVPRLTEVEFYDQAIENNFHLFSARGTKNILPRLEASIADINQVNSYDWLVVVCDTEEREQVQVRAEILDFLATNGLKLDRGQIEVLIQHRCIETWFLGNREIIPASPRTAKLREHFNNYDVSKLDPELLPKYGTYRRIAHIHKEYLELLFLEKGWRYNKSEPRYVTELNYLEQLQQRVAAERTHLKSFQSFLEFCERLRPEAA